MKKISILNDVLGPVMRGPSSSHTAAAYHLAVLTRALLGEEPAEVKITFDPDGSYGKVYRVQGADLAFAMGYLGWPITDARFAKALDLAKEEGLGIKFAVETLPEADHPNTVRMELTGKKGKTLHVVGKSTGGGSVEINTLEGWPVLLTGESHEVMVEAESSVKSEIHRLLHADQKTMAEPDCHDRDGELLYCIKRSAPLPAETTQILRVLKGVKRIWIGKPLHFMKQGTPPFCSAEEMIALAEREKLSAGQAALRYEAELLGATSKEVLEAMMGRLDIMIESVHRGLEAELPPMQLLRPTARKIYEAEKAGQVSLGGTHTRAAARALAAMHVNCGMGVVCAAPTAGSAGVLPAVAATLLEEMGFSREQVALALLAAGAVGMILAERATFAAEIAGCQVEIGAAGAMAAGAVVEAAGGSARQAADAAAIAFQNTMGSVCDLVQGVVEIPCHTRNAVAASSAFVCADLILGGYENPIPLDETMDAVYAVGKMLPTELKVTALGGLALAPSAQALKKGGTGT